MRAKIRNKKDFVILSDSEESIRRAAGIQVHGTAGGQIFRYRSG
jgi:hypothetical protein